MFRLELVCCLLKFKFMDVHRMYLRTYFAGMAYWGVDGLPTYVYVN